MRKGEIWKLSVCSRGELIIEKFGKIFDKDSGKSKLVTSYF